MIALSHDVVHVCAILIELSLGALFIHKIGAARILKRYSESLKKEKNARATEILTNKTTEILSDAKIKSELLSVLAEDKPTDVEINVRGAHYCSVGLVILAAFSLVIKLDIAAYDLIRLFLSLGAFLSTVYFYDKCIALQEALDEAISVKTQNSNSNKASSDPTSL